MILTLKTDSPVAEIGLYDAGTQVGYIRWQADRNLARDLLGKIKDQLASAHADWHDITGIVVFEGPGSFTGLRIGITVANALAYSLPAPIVAVNGDKWVATGLGRLAEKQDDRIALPQYGAEAHITAPKK